MISIIVGKPGSGKSYYVVSKIVEQLEEMLLGWRDPRKVVTNLSLQQEAIVDVLYSRHKKNHDRVEIEQLVNQNVRVLSLDDLKYNRDYVAEGEEYEKKVAGKIVELIAPTSLAFWWNRLENHALIVIDEFQRYVSSSGESTESERQSLIDFFSTHRHKAQDWIILSQNLMSVSLDVRRVTEEVSQILNAKSVILPFPINIPLRDFQYLLYAFGKYNQVFRVTTAQLLNSNRLSKDDVLNEVVKTSTDVFKCYQTRTRGGQETKGIDGSLPYSIHGNIKKNAVVWFFWKHSGHMLIKVLAVVLLYFGISNYHVFIPGSKSKTVASGADLPISEPVVRVSPPTDRKSSQGRFRNVPENDFFDNYCEFEYYRCWLSNVQRIRRGENLR